MKKKWYVLLVLALFVFQGVILSAADEPPKKAVKLINKAEKALKKNELDEALENYNKALELAPEYGPIYFGIGQIQVNRKQYDEAIVNLEKAVKLSPDAAKVKQFFANALFNAAKEKQGLNMDKKASDYLLKVFAIEGIDTMDPPLYREALYHLGNSYARQKDMANSTVYFEKLLAVPGIESADAKLLFQTAYRAGLNYYQVQQFKKAAALFEKVIAVPGAQTFDARVYATSHYLVGLNESQARNYDKSNKFLKEFMELNQDPAARNPQLEPLAYFLLGTNHMSLLDTKVQKIRDQKPKDLKNQIAELARKYADIPTYLSKAIDANPKLEPAYMHIGNYYYYADNIPKAVETYKTLIANFPNSPDIATYKQFLADIENPAKKSKK
jgi:tetratricopeptide (TPR) repeat protein